MFALVAQLVELLSARQIVAGSSPAQCFCDIMRGRKGI